MKVERNRGFYFLVIWDVVFISGLCVLTITKVLPKGALVGGSLVWRVVRFIYKN